ncbi:MAG: hypothetical protein ACI9R3_005640 [Verrucomicrobiales bacterium]|jgi:hypothetical protein
MKTNMLRKTHSALSEGLALILLTSLSMSAFAGKGGVKGPPGGDGGDGEEPPPPAQVPPVSPTPIHYQARIIDAADPADWADPVVPWGSETNVGIDFYDINRDGVAVGIVYARDLGTQYAIMATATGGLQQLETVFGESLAREDLAGFSIRNAYEINADGWIACRLKRSTANEHWVAVGNINEGRGNSLRIVQGPLSKAGYSLISDLNENGDLITVPSVSTGRKSPYHLSYDHWLVTATKGSSGNLDYKDPPVYLTPFLSETFSSFPQLNTKNLQIAYRSESDVHRLDLAAGDNDTISSPVRLNTYQHEIADDGSVYTFNFTREPSRKREGEGYPARWTPDVGLQQIGELQTQDLAMKIVAASAALEDESEIPEVLMSTRLTSVNSDTNLEIYRSDSDLGTRFKLSVSAGDLVEWGESFHDLWGISRPNDVGLNGHGHICGNSLANDWQSTGGHRKGLILIPVSVQ